jgi:ankyrin repeat protein
MIQRRSTIMILQQRIILSLISSIVFASISTYTMDQRTPKEKFLDAAYEGLEEVEKYFDASLIDEQNDDGNTSLHIATIFGDIKLIKFLLARGANLEKRNDQQQTPLLMGASHNHPNIEMITEILLDNKADIEARDEDGETALANAVDNYNYQLIKLLLNHGANINPPDTITPLHLVAYEANDDDEGQLEMAQFLLDHGANPNALDYSGMTPLHYIARKNSATALKIALLLLERGADVDALTKYGDTPLSIAALEDNHPIVLILIHHGASIHTNENIHNPIHTALSKNHILLAIALAEHLGHPTSYWTYIHDKAMQHINNTLEVNDQTMNNTIIDILQKLSREGFLLHTAIQLLASFPLTDEATENLILLLLEHNPQLINTIDTKKRTPLYYALTNKLYTIAEQLLKAGANPLFNPEAVTMTAHLTKVETVEETENPQDERSKKRRIITHPVTILINRSAEHHLWCILRPLIQPQEIITDDDTKVIRPGLIKQMIEIIISFAWPSYLK